MRFLSFALKMIDKLPHSAAAAIMVTDIVNGLPDLRNCISRAGCHSTVPDTVQIIEVITNVCHFVKER